MCSRTSSSGGAIRLTGLLRGRSHRSIVTTRSIRGMRDPRKWRMLNCTPAFAFCSPSSMACGVQTLCPFCWSRAALAIWRQIDTAVLVHLRGGYRCNRVGHSGAVIAGCRPCLRVSDDEATPALTCRPDLVMIVRSISYTLPDVPDGMKPSWTLVDYRQSRGKPRDATAPVAAATLNVYLVDPVSSLASAAWGSSVASTRRG